MVSATRFPTLRAMPNSTHPGPFVLQPDAAPRTQANLHEFQGTPPAHRTTIPVPEQRPPAFDAALEFVGLLFIAAVFGAVYYGGRRARQNGAEQPPDKQSTVKAEGKVRKRKSRDGGA